MDHNQLHYQSPAAFTSDQPGQKLVRHETRKPVPTKNNRRFGGAGDGSGMRAIFLIRDSGNTASGGGTGVFLPRVNDNNSTEPHQRPRCSSVLIPSRVTQALMLHFRNGGNSSSFLPQHVADIADRKNTGMCIYYPNKMISHQPPLNGPNLDNYNDNNSGVQLPEEWIY